MKLSDASDDILVKAFVELRDKRKVLKDTYTADDATLKARQDKIEGEILQRYNTRGTESSRTAHGTAYKTTVGYASVADREALKAYVLSNDAWELLTIAANKTSVKQHIDEHADVPPGVNWREEVHIRVQRA